MSTTPAARDHDDPVISSEPAVASEGLGKGQIEIGVIVAGPLDMVDARAAKLAVEQSDAKLREWFPRFRFNFFEIKRPEMTSEGRVEPSVLLRGAMEERDAKHWDFAVVLTAAELVGNYSPFCFAALSRPLDAAAISLSLIDPLALGVEVDHGTRIERIARRLSRLMLHALAHLTGLNRSDDPTNLLFHPSDARELDQMTEVDPEELNRQREAFAAIADQRLEEQAHAKRSSWPIFATRAAWINRREIAEAVMAARPWEFPKRLSRLTIASFSTLAVLFMTAESWDLALAQRPWRVMVLVLASLLMTTFYVILRQQLLVRRGQRRSEQSVVTSVSAFGIVGAGMAVTWLTLFAIGILLAHLLFPTELIATWAGSTVHGESELSWIDRPHMAMFSASLGLLIGALGASFENQHYFRHIIFVDEEI